MNRGVSNTRIMPLVPIIASVALIAGAGLVQAQEEQYDVTFDVSDWAELNMQMDEGATIEWDVRSTQGGEFYLDLHSHQGGQETFHEQFQSTTGESGTFSAPGDGVYSIYVQNLDASDIRIRVQVIGDFAVESEEGIEPIDENGSPGPALPLILLAGFMLAASQGGRSRGRR